MMFLFETKVGNMLTLALERYAVCMVAKVILLCV